MALGRNSQYLPPMGVGVPGAPVQGGGGGSAQTLKFRDPVDAARTMMGQRVPSAEYPDGYLGTIQSRREDRVLNDVKSRLNDRAYQRGVHKGERIDASDYYWPEGYGPDSGIERQSEAVQPDMLDRKYYAPRAAPQGTLHDRLTVMGERMPRNQAEVLLGDPRAIADYNRLRPPWSS